LTKLPFLVLAGSVNYEWLGGIRKLRVAGVGNKDDTLILPSILTAGDGTYEIVIDAAALSSVHCGKAATVLTFDGAFRTRTARHR